MSKSIPALAPLIPYSVPSIPSIYSVEGALDYLFYEPITTNINVTPSIVETGSTVTSVVLNWSLSRIPDTSLTVTDISSIDINQITNSVTLNSLTLTTNKTYVLTVIDNGNTVSSSTTINFRFKNYWGSSSNNSPSNNDVLNFNNAAFLNTKNGVYSYSNLNNEYIYLAFPTSYGTPVFTVNGLIVTFDLININNFTNSSGGITNYSLFKSINLLNGSVTINVA